MQIILDVRQIMLTATEWMALRRPDIGWSDPFNASAREANATSPRCLGVQRSQKRCHARPHGGSSSASCQIPASSVRTWRLRTPPSAHAQPHISRLDDSSIFSCGVGETITDSGAIDQTGMTLPVSPLLSSSTGSLYQRVVNGPAARLSERFVRVSHLTVFVQYTPGTSRRAGKPCSAGNALPFIS